MIIASDSIFEKDKKNKEFFILPYTLNKKGMPGSLPHIKIS